MESHNLGDDGMNMQDKDNIEQDVVSDDKTAILLDIDKKSVTIECITIYDEDTYKLLLDLKESERADLIRRIIRIGTRVVKDTIFTDKIDYLEGRLTHLTDEFKDVVDERLGKDGDLKKILEPLKDMLNIENPMSPLYRLIEIVNENVASRNNEANKILDINDPNSPLHIIRRDIIERMDNVGEKIARYEGRKEIYDKSTQKGGEFEDNIHYFLNEITTNNFDIVNRISQTRGVIGTKGDFLIEVYNIKKKILVEVKAKEEVNTKYANDYLDECLQNWPDTSFSILVYKEDHNGTLKGIRFEKYNRIICEFGDEGIMLEAAYRFARICLINEYNYSLALNRKDKEYRSTMSDMNAYSIRRIEIRNAVNEAIRYIREIKKIRDDLKKSFDIYSDSFGQSITNIDKFKMNINYRLGRLENMLGPQEKNIEEKEQTLLEDIQIHQKDIQIHEDQKDIQIHEDQKDIQIHEDQKDIPKSPKSPEDFWIS